MPGRLPSFAALPHQCNVGVLVSVDQIKEPVCSVCHQSVFNANSAPAPPPPPADGEEAQQISEPPEGGEEEKQQILPPEKVVILRCGHFFHPKCIQEWFDDSGQPGHNTCPLCREPFDCWDVHPRANCNQRRVRSRDDTDMHESGDRRSRTQYYEDPSAEDLLSEEEGEEFAPDAVEPAREEEEVVRPLPMSEPISEAERLSMNEQANQLMDVVRGTPHNASLWSSLIGAGDPPLSYNGMTPAAIMEQMLDWYQIAAEATFGSDNERLTLHEQQKAIDDVRELKSAMPQDLPEEPAPHLIGMLVRAVISCHRLHQRTFSILEHLDRDRTKDYFQYASLLAYSVVRLGVKCLNSAPFSVHVDILPLMRMWRDAPDREYFTNVLLQLRSIDYSPRQSFNNWVLLRTVWNWRAMDPE